MREIRGKKAVVTGAAAGIGRAVALGLAREGADLFLLDVDAERLDDLCRDAQKLGVEAIAAPCDVRDPGQIAAAVNLVLERWGRVEILVNNAGVAYYGATHRMAADDWEWLFAINLLAPARFIQLLLPTLRAQRESHIVNVSSMMGLVAYRRAAAYSASKFGLVGLSEALRAEYPGQSPGVTVVCPGFVETNLFRAGRCDRKSRAFPAAPAWLTTTPDIVAARTIRAIRRNQAQVVITPLARVLWYAKRLFPGLLDRLRRFGSKREPAEMLARSSAQNEPALSAGSAGQP